MALTTPRRKRIRLDPKAYAEPSAICSIALTVLHREPIFAQVALVTGCVDALRRRSAATCVIVHAFCFMPDHLHLLLSPSPTTSVVEFVRDFKGETTHIAWRFGHEGPLWQRSFYDHFLRRDEDVERVVRYILANPVRAGLVETATEYPYSGAAAGAS